MNNKLIIKLEQTINALDNIDYSKHDYINIISKTINELEKIILEIKSNQTIETIKPYNDPLDW